MGVRGNKKEQDQVERLEKENRELKALNRSLLKQIKKLSKGIYKQEFEEAMDKKVEEHGQKEEPRPRERKCPNCARTGGLISTEIAGRRFERCDHCDYKSGRLK